MRLRDLNRQRDGREDMEQGLSKEWRNNLEGLKGYLSELQEEHKKILEQSSLFDEKLQSIEKEIAELLIVYQKALNNKKQEIKSLRTGQEDLLEDIGNRLTTSQKREIVNFYVKNNYTLTNEKLKEFVDLTGIQISDVGFRKVCKRMGVYKTRKEKTMQNRRKRARRKKAR